MDSEVNELLDLPVFQVLTFVSNDVSDGGRFAAQINSDRGLLSLGSFTHPEVDGVPILSMAQTTI